MHQHTRSFWFKTWDYYVLTNSIRRQFTFRLGISGDHKLLLNIKAWNLILTGILTLHHFFTIYKNMNNGCFSTFRLNHNTLLWFVKG